MVATGVNQPRTGVVSRVRMIAFYTANALLGLIVAADFVMHALTFADPHLIHVAAHEIISGAIIGAVISQFVAPRRAIAAAQTLLVMFVAAWLMDALTLRFSGFGVVMLLGVLVVGLHPARGAVLSFRGGFSPALAVMTVLSAIPLIPYTQMEVAYQLQDFEPVHALLGHWEWAATWAALTMLLGALAALKTPGFRFAAWATGLGAVVFGSVSLFYPGEASAVSPIWAIVAIAGGALFIATAEWEARRKASQTIAAIKAI